MNTDWNWDCELCSEVCYSAQLLLLKSNLTCPLQSVLSPLEWIHPCALICIQCTNEFTCISRKYLKEKPHRLIVCQVVLFFFSGTSAILLTAHWPLQTSRLLVLFQWKNHICAVDVKAKTSIFQSSVEIYTLVLFHVSLSALTNTELDETRSPWVLVRPRYDTGRPNLLLITVGL